MRFYNYRDLRDELAADGWTFKTESDTETLLVSYLAWGKLLLDKVRGMFAFAIWDKQRGELFCARDFFGIKPFYYTVQNGEAGSQFIFASEIKCILEHPAYERELNEERWSSTCASSSRRCPRRSSRASTSWSPRTA